MTHSKSKKSNKQNRSTRKYESSIAPMMQAARSPIAIRRFIISISGTLTTTAGGVLSGSFGMDPSGGSTWSSIALLYDQFRVIGGQLKMVPRTSLNSANISGLVRFAFDNDSTTVPTSLNELAGYSELTEVPAVWTSGAIKVVNFKRPMIKGVVQGQQLWYNETAPSSSPGALKFYGDGLTASTAYINYVLDYLVEFQMRSS